MSEDFSSYRFIFLLEEKSMQSVLEIILPKLLPENSFKCIPHEGKQDLRKSIPRKLRAFKNLDRHPRFVIVHDQDSSDCQILKAELLKICSEVAYDNVIVRIICRELESWFLGDLAAIEKGFSLKQRSLSGKQNKTTFRDPDRLNSAKQELLKLVPNYQAISGARKIAPCMSLDHNKSYSFNVFLATIQDLSSNTHEHK
jgi:hypothetical protein